MSVENTLNERGNRYGKFADHAKIAQSLQEALFAAPNWFTMDYDIRQALCVICDKMARICNGDPYYTDNYHDIQGYAKLVETRLLEMKAQKAKEQQLFEGSKSINQFREKPFPSQEEIDRARKDFNTIRTPETPEFNERWNKPGKIQLVEAERPE